MPQARLTLLAVSVGFAMGSHALGQSVDGRLEPSHRTLDLSAPFQAEIVADFDEPWAMTFLPDGRMLVTEKRGTLHVVTKDGRVSRPIAGVPPVE
jgi:glucose/arabinose dehydrogenase